LDTDLPIGYSDTQIGHYGTIDIDKSWHFDTNTTTYFSIQKIGQGLSVGAVTLNTRSYGWTTQYLNVQGGNLAQPAAYSKINNGSINVFCGLLCYSVLPDQCSSLVPFYRTQPQMVSLFFT